MTRVSGPRLDRTTVISDGEFQDMLDKARETIPEYYGLRDPAILCILRLTGKRAVEVVRLKQGDLEIKEGNLSMTFTVAKKRRKETLNLRREKQVPLTDPLTAPILEYREFMQKNVGDQIEWLFPRTHYSPTFGTVTLNPSRHLSTRQLLRIVQKYNPLAWVHLFRETQGADIVRKDQSIMAVWKVKRRLDLEKTETAWRYMDRYGSDVIKRDLEKEP